MHRLKRDNDGFLDMYFGTGEPPMRSLVPNVMLRNAAGQRFQEVTTAGGFGHLQKGHGIAFGDIDNDGDQDIYVVMGGAFSGDTFRDVLFHNPGNDHHWLTVQLRGTRSNRLGHGARIRIVVETAGGERREIHRVVGSGGSFGASSLQQEIGLGAARRIELLEVRWPGGATDRHTQVPMDRVVRVTQGAAGVEIIELPAIKLPIGTRDVRSGDNTLEY